MCVCEIGSWAFYQCSSLKNITIPNIVEIIGRHVLFGKTRGIICRTIFELIVICSTSANFDQTVKTHTHTVCAPYYKAAPFNISHT